MEEEQYVLPDQTDPPLALLDEDKRKKVNNFRDIFKNDESLNEEQREYVDEYVAYRYLKARDWDVDLAEQMLRGTLKWRDEFKPHKITAKDVESQIRAGHMYQEGFDKYKRPVIFLKVHTEEDPHSELEKLQFMIHCMEVASNVMDKERGVEKMVWVCSCLGYNMKYNGAVGFAREILNILQNHYPERLGALFCFDAPWIFRCFWKVVSPFVDSKTLKKIFFVQGSIKERQEVLEPFFDLDDLQKDFGGNKEWEFDADAYFDRLIEDEKKAAAAKNDGNGEEKKTKKNKKDKKEKKKKKKEEEGKGEENSQNGNDEESD